MSIAPPMGKLVKRVRRNFAPLGLMSEFYDSGDIVEIDMDPPFVVVLIRYGVRYRLNE